MQNVKATQSILAIFFRHYTAYRNGKLALAEFTIAYRMLMTTIYKYIINTEKSLL